MIVIKKNNVKNFPKYIEQQEQALFKRSVAGFGRVLII